MSIDEKVKQKSEGQRRNNVLTGRVKEVGYCRHTKLILATIIKDDVKKSIFFDPTNPEAEKLFSDYAETKNIAIAYSIENPIQDESDIPNTEKIEYINTYNITLPGKVY